MICDPGACHLKETLTRAIYFLSAVKTRHLILLCQVNLIEIIQPGWLAHNDF